MTLKNSLVLILVIALASVPVESYGQRKSKNKKVVEHVVNGKQGVNLKATPKLVVGIVVDQMRYDYITRFWDDYDEDGGFKRLVNDGFNCKNNHFNYAPTVTGPGHASVYTGTTPATHGVIGNNWYDKESGVSVYCAGDDDYASVGTTSDDGKMSPHRLLTSTITDQLRLSTQMRGKTIAMSIKDRGAVLPGGHTANAAYWFRGSDEGNWITSTYYMNSLPKWVSDFNGSNVKESYKKPWTTLKDINEYLESGADNNAYEGLFKGETAPVFPHDLPKLWDDNGKFDIIKSTPYGNSILADFAIAALDGENLGQDIYTDFLAVSFSSTDYVGHKYGVNSKEVQDTYVRLDQDLKRLLDALDTKVGEGQYTVFLSADHGAGHVPSFLMDHRLPASYSSSEDVNAKFAKFVEFTYGTSDLIKNRSGSQIFLDHQVIKNLDLKPNEVQETLAAELLGYQDIESVFTGYQMWQNEYTHGVPYLMQNGYNQKRSGDILIVPKPATTSSKTGSGHGSPQIYDTHVPLLFYGMGIKKGSTVNRTEIPDIAATIAASLGIAFPTGTTGEPIAEVLE